MINPLVYPKLKSPKQLKHPYPPIAGKINKPALFLAQQYARFARNCSDKKASERYINKANYILTAAYMGAESHQYFWEQFN